MARSLLSPAVHIAWSAHMHRFLSVCLSVFTQATLCTTTMVYGVLVHQQGAICSTKAQYAPWCTRETIFFEKFRGPWKIGGAKGAFIPLLVAHKEHTSVWVICRLSTYVCNNSAYADNRANAVDRRFICNLCLKNSATNKDKINIFITSLPACPGIQDCPEGPRIHYFLSASRLRDTRLTTSSRFTILGGVHSWHWSSLKIIKLQISSRNIYLSVEVPWSRLQWDMGCRTTWSMGEKQWSRELC